MFLLICLCVTFIVYSMGIMMNVFLLLNLEENESLCYFCQCLERFKYQFSYQIYQLLATDLIIAKTSCLAAIITVNNCCYSTVDVKKNVQISHNKT